ncbi:hypothetical protein DICPUDRAFT_152903 [Dictyostelium purpureum]|uniref:Carbohydrate binding domain-containing protein n=1 Tax=Dictyostelium purpureum TaxID=5786 RepID=F0ZMK1_DICPU|nr:uncharacterized protein DICPUDRAFT_152903 [Dictyostelium purpureum]EGC34829.1 hypothetical protein DICPUDRAFT_152903 [Dictyostelium purpureum]|eukprot:XP_003288636.1 hypothetical protein DICPUDRAFT_152903 [Dictyostelium purpureum]
MKLLLSLILIIAFVGSFINAVNVRVPQKNIKGDYCLNVLKDIYGYNSNFTAVSSNGQTDAGQNSFFENGYISIDYENEQMFVVYDVDLQGKQVSGQTWMFSKNQTQYVLADNQCYKVPFNGEFPTNSDLQSVGFTTLGMVQAENLQPVNQVDGTTQTLTVDSTYCSPMTIQIVSSDNGVSGYTIMNFNNYKETIISSDFILPSECASASTSLKSVKSHKAYPELLKKLL